MLRYIIFHRIRVLHEVSVYVLFRRTHVLYAVLLDSKFYCLQCRESNRCRKSHFITLHLEWIDLQTILTWLPGVKYGLEIQFTLSSGKGKIVSWKQSVGYMLWHGLPRAMVAGINVERPHLFTYRSPNLHESNNEMWRFDYRKLGIGTYEIWCYSRNVTKFSNRRFSHARKCLTTCGGQSTL